MNNQIIFNVITASVAIISLIVSLSQLYLQYRRKCLVSFTDYTLIKPGFNTRKYIYSASIINASRETIHITYMSIYSRTNKKNYIIKDAECFPCRLPIGLNRGEGFVALICTDDIYNILSESNSKMENDLEVHFKDSLGKIYKASYKQ